MAKRITECVSSYFSQNPNSTSWAIFFHYLIGHNTEYLIGGSIQRKLISILLQCILDLLCSFHCRFADPQVQPVRKQLTKLDSCDPSLGKQCSMLLDDRKEMRNPVLSAV